MMLLDDEAQKRQEKMLDVNLYFVATTCCKNVHTPTLSKER
jgi:hypothetical protein